MYDSLVRLQTLETDEAMDTGKAAGTPLYFNQPRIKVDNFLKPLT